MRDVAGIREVLRAKKAHPNDHTPDDLTVFRVSWHADVHTLIHFRLMNAYKYAIRSGDAEIVKLLLDHGADPNLSFGQYNTYGRSSLKLSQAKKALGVLSTMLF